MSLQEQRFQSNKDKTREQHLPFQTFLKMAGIKHKESARRSLFGPVDHDSLRQDLKQRLKEISEQENHRWNFNFQTDSPLPGRFQWVEIQEDSAASIYRESSQMERTTACAAEASKSVVSCEEGTDQENCSSISNTPTKNTEITSVRVKRKLVKSLDVSRSNARITDFFVKRRRTSELRMKFQHTSSSETSPCKTIR